jgi:hypothetical protein
MGKISADQLCRYFPVTKVVSGMPAMVRKYPHQRFVAYGAEISFGARSGIRKYPHRRFVAGGAEISLSSVQGHTWGNIRTKGLWLPVQIFPCPWCKVRDKEMFAPKVCGLRCGIFLVFGARPCMAKYPHQKSVASGAEISLWPFMGNGGEASRCADMSLSSVLH